MAQFACGSVEWDSLFQEMWHNVPYFLKKIKKYHAAAGKICCYREQMARLNAHCVNRVIYW